MVLDPQEYVPLPRDHVDTSLGSMFGRYRLEELIGRGGMGEIYRAFDTGHDRLVALKRLPAALATDPVFQARFRSEAALAARLHEPHVIPIHDFGEIDGQLYIDMRLVEGPDLATVLHRGPLPPRRVVDIVTQIACALDAAHAAGLVHRDIKPANVLITGSESGSSGGEFVYVADFGIARAIDGSTSGSLTSTGTMVVASVACGAVHRGVRGDRAPPSPTKTATDPPQPGNRCFRHPPRHLFGESEYRT